VVYFKAAKDLAWRDPGLRTQLRRAPQGYLLQLQAARLARAVWLDFGDIDAELSDNALTLLPGERATVRVTSAASLAALRRALRVRALGQGGQP
jgi:beta-mannosidase